MHINQDFSKATKAKHNHIKLTIDGISKTYPGTNALITICNHIGIIKVAEINLTTNGLRLLVKYIPMGKENKYMEMGNGSIFIGEPSGQYKSVSLALETSISLQSIIRSTNFA